MSVYLDYMKDCKWLVDTWRQTGTTTSLVNLIRENGGILVMPTMEQARCLIKQYPYLKDQIISISQVGTLRGRSYVRKVFFDNSLISNLLATAIDEKLLKENFDGYHFTTPTNNTATLNDSDGYTNNNKQLNIKVSEEDLKDLNTINKYFFDNEFTNSGIGRNVLRKGIQFYKKLMS